MYDELANKYSMYARECLQLDGVRLPLAYESVRFVGFSPTFFSLLSRRIFSFAAENLIGDIIINHPLTEYPTRHFLIAHFFFCHGCS